MQTGADQDSTLLPHGRIQKGGSVPPPKAAGKRLLFVSKTAASTGPTTSLNLLVERLRHRHRVEVLVQGEGPFCEWLERTGIPYRSFQTLGRRTVPSLVRFFQRNRFDLVYANETSKASRHVCASAALTGIPFMSHVRSMGWDHGWLRLGHLRLARGVVAVSESCAASVRRFVRAGRLHVVHNGVPSTAFVHGSDADRLQVRAELGISAGVPLLIIVSHVTPRKGQKFGVEAMIRLREALPDVHLAIVGALDRDPGYVHELRGRVREMGLVENVSILGFRPDVSRLLGAADVLVHTALADPHPRAVLEGMAAGLPVVAFDTDGVSETVEHGQTGWLVPPKDIGALASALVSLLTADEELRTETGEAGRARARDLFPEARTALQLEALLEQVFSGHTGRAR